MDKIKYFQAFGEADDTAVSKEAWLDSARACKKPGGLCFDFDYCEENFKLVGSIFFENRESFVDNILSDCHYSDVINILLNAFRLKKIL